MNHTDFAGRPVEYLPRRRKLARLPQCNKRHRLMKRWLKTQQRKF